MLAFGYGGEAVAIMLRASDGYGSDRDRSGLAPLGYRARSVRSVDVCIAGGDEAWVAPASPSDDQPYGLRDLRVASYRMICSTHATFSAGDLKNPVALYEWLDGRSA